MITASSRKVLVKVDDNDFSDCANVGYTWTLYEDGRVTAEYHTRWQGSTDGTRYTTEPEYANVSVIRVSIIKEWTIEKIETFLREILLDVDPATDEAFRMTRKGWTVQ